MDRKILAQLTGGVFALGLTGLTQAAQWDVSITNLTHGTYFAPVLVTAHGHDTHLFEPGMAASSALREAAECGSLTALISLPEIGGVDADTVENPAAGPLAPGDSTMAMLTTSDTHLSIVAMMVPTNDGFIGLDSVHIPGDAGTYTYYLDAYDAGTEANDELMDTSGCTVGMPGIPAAPGGDAGSGGSGVSSADSNTMIHVHRGVLGDTDATAGASDLDSTVHRWQNPVAKVVVTVTP